MDPGAAWDRLITVSPWIDDDDRAEALDALVGWLSRGGFEPAAWEIPTDPRSARLAFEVRRLSRLTYKDGPSGVALRKRCLQLAAKVDG